MYRFEAGTPNIAGVLAFNTVIDWMKAINWQQAENYAFTLRDYTENQLAKLRKTSFVR
ncbi:aminotransferase class V-fold PLP-dependent enzyme [Arsenophonus endosymbiont of Bemisia tabaci]|uniref:aminotransferase class V-fold PLP-dependent enzyme n=1 Tax=Arsenophonus endosymbiont of Bemisia tabaci TaxID=536059 RepID=UPI002107BE2C|nr:aminotransferase class V-fold PLP-dependent enzyme [Arsenophonus endosymbiont of Bemisia tabaci]